MKKTIILGALAALIITSFTCCTSVAQQSANFQQQAAAFAQACEPLHTAEINARRAAR